MKKNIAIIILSIIILILIIALIFMWLKVKDKTIKDVVTEKIQILDGPGMVRESKDLDMEEWRKVISVFMKSIMVINQIM